MKSFLKTIIIVIFAITSINATDYYWVGGSGEWSQLSHWATTSGGGVTHAQVPTSEDDVVFDSNSFSGNGQTVTMTTDIVFFKSMDWSGVSNSVNLVGGRNVIVNSFGSVDLGTQVNFAFDGTFIFTGSSTGNIINFGTNSAGKMMHIAGDGDWTLQNNLEVDSIFQIDRGSLNSNNNNIRCQYFYINSDDTKSLSLGSSYFEIWGHYGDRMYYGDDFDTIPSKINTTNLTFDAGSSTIEFSAAPTQWWFSGNGSIDFNIVSFSNNRGRHYIRPYNSDPQVSFNELTLNSHTQIDGRHSITNLNLSRNKVYRFESGRNFMIDNISATGTCAEGIIITATDAGSSTTFTSPSGIMMDFVTLRDINGSGGSFSATNSTDLGNNTNWTFTNSNTLNFYWIGGTGNWTDPNHWALTSGGTPSGCVPAGKDNAFFDTNSFTGAGQTVTINIDDVFIRDMVWDNVTGTPDLIGDEEFNMHITGSLEFDENMNHSFGGIYYFESSESGNTITTNGNQFNRELQFSGQSSDWTLMDDVFVQWNLSLNSGTLNTGGNNLDIFRYESYGSRTRHFNLENSTITIHDIIHPDGYAICCPDWRVETENYTTQADNSHIIINSVYYVSFGHEGPNRLAYNKLTFNSYGGTIYGYNHTDGNLSSTTIDSCIINLRGQMWNNQEFNYLQLTAGYDYNFASDNEFKINELAANGTCDKGHITISSSNAGRQALFDIDNDHTFERLIVRDIRVSGSATLTANNSVDEGNNDGWVFTNVTIPRILYWVNDDGLWEDMSHWSLSSGGPGGECIPTSVDDVFFDENSFSLMNQGVNSDANRLMTCHNMTWINPFGNPMFGNESDNVKIHGSLRYDQDMRNYIYWHFFHTSEVDSVNVNGNETGAILMKGDGELVFQDDIINWSTEHSNGSLIFDNIKYNTNWYYMYNANDNPINAELKGSSINVGRMYSQEAAYENTANNYTYDAGSSTIYLDAPLTRIINNSGTEFNRIISTDPQGTAFIGDRYPSWGKDPSTPAMMSQSIRFAGNGEMYGNMISDTIIGAPGKTYTLEVGETQTVNNYLQLIGNNCTPIQLQSTSSGSLATFSMPASAEVVADFVQMRDNQGTGGADFVAGSRSTDISNSNVGWTFEDPPEYVETGFLGVDQTLCRTASVELNAYNYSPNEIYQWGNGSSDSTLLVNSTGTYNVTVTFDNNCVIEDEIIILEPTDFNVNFMEDTVICDGTSIVLDAHVGIQGVNYLWDNNLTTATREVSEAGTYKVVAEFDGCTSEDSITVGVQEIPIIDLGVDQSFCEGEAFTLDASFPSATYMWQDGSNGEMFVGNMAGIYWAETELNNCFFRDSIEIEYVETPAAEIGNDTTLCSGQTLALSTEFVDGATITWQDGTTGTDYFVDAEGPYFISVDIDGCINSDSIFVTYQDAPDFDLGESIKGCEGETFNLSTEVSAVSYSWNTGENTDNIDVSMSGSYVLTLDLGQCVLVDSLEVNITPFPNAEIGNDTTLCTGQTLALSNVDVPGASLIWQDGTTGTDYQVTSEGPYFITIDLEGCIDVDSIFVTYQDAPSFDLGEAIMACEGDIVNLSTDVSADTYTWNTGDNMNNVDVTTNGSYVLSLDLGQCTLIDSVEVTFNPYPVAEIGIDTTLCTGQTLSLSNDPVDGANISWQDGTSGTDYEVTSEGPYVITIDLQGCIDKDSIFVTYQEAPELELGEAIEACEGDVINISTNVMADLYAWSTGDIGNNIDVSTSGNYSLSINVGQCTLQDDVDVIIYSYPIVDLGADEVTICDGEVLSLDAGGVGQWQDGSMIQVFDATSEGQYKVVVSNQGCETSDSVNLIVLPLPDVDLGDSNLGACEGDVVILNAPSGLMDFVWENGSLDIQREITETGNYVIEAEQNGCFAKDSIFIDFQVLPLLNLGLDTTVCDDTGILLVPEKTTGTILWDDGSTGNSFQVSEPGLIRATIDNNGCMNSDSVFISFRECRYFGAYIPNAFSPNEDGNNDTFKPTFQEGVNIFSYSMFIFDRWGNKMFSATSLDQEWDGRVNFKLAATGIYVYVIEVSFQDDRTSGTETITGDVLVLK